MHTIFLYAVYQKNSKLVIHLLENFADIILSTPDPEDRNIAHYFAEVGLLEAIDYLAKKPHLAIFLTKPDKKACTPFICAVLNNQTEIVNYLIENQYAHFASPAHAAAFSNDLTQIKYLYEQKKLNETDSLNVDILGYAVAGGNVAVINFLIESSWVSDYKKYPQLFMIALEMEHYNAAPILLKKMRYSELIQQIPKLTKFLASKKSNEITKLIHQLIIEKMTIPNTIVSHHPYFITGAIIHDSLPVFSFFIEKFFAEKIYTQSPTSIGNIFALIDEYKRIRFTKALVNAIYPIAKESPGITLHSCCHIANLNNPIFLDVFLNEIKKKDAQHIKKLEYQTNLKLLIDEIVKHQNILTFFVFNQHFNENKPQKGTSKENTKLYFLNISSQFDYSQLSYYYPTHYQFFDLVNQIINQPNLANHYYPELSKILHEYRIIPENNNCLEFTKMAIESLFSVMEKKSMEEPADWEFLQKVYSDIKYLTLAGQLKNKILGLKRLIKPAFIFSDYTYIINCVDQILNQTMLPGEKILTPQLINLYFCKICTIFISELSFYPSNEIKKILLNEYLSIGESSFDFIFGVYFLSLLPKKTLTQKTNKKLLEKFSLLDFKKNDNDIHELLLSQNEICSMIHSIRMVHYSLTQLTTWIEKIKIEKPDDFPTQENSEKTLQYHIQTLKNYKIHYQIKTITLETIHALFNQLKNFSQKITLVIQPNKSYHLLSEEIDNLLLDINELRKSCFSSETFEDKLKKYKAELAMLCAADLLAEEDLVKYKQRKAQEKRPKKEPPKKPLISQTSQCIEKNQITHEIKSARKISEKKFTTNQKLITQSKLLENRFFQDTKDDNTPWITVGKKKWGAIQKNNISIALQNDKKTRNTHQKNNLNSNHNNRNSSSISLEKKPIVQTKNYAMLKKILTSGFDSILTPTTLKSCGFSITLPNAVNHFFACFLPNQLFLVGGAIRNALTGKKINDFDFIAFISTEKIQQQFKNHRIQGYGKKSIIVITYEGHEFDVLAIESETYQEALLHGTITTETAPSLLKKEHQKRDFSMNALYFNPTLGIVDICGGLVDLLFNRMLKPITPGSSHFKFQHSIRILRGLRFSVQFHCIISFELRSLMLQNIHFLYTVTKAKLEKEYESLVNLLGQTYAYQLYRNYYISDLLARRGITVTQPTWQAFWQHDLTANPNDQRLNHIGQVIQNDLPKKDLASFASTSRYYFTFFSVEKKIDGASKSTSIGPELK